MHTEAYEWMHRHRTSGQVSVLDLGGRNVNGTPRDLFPNAEPYVVVDIADGPNVDIIADASTWVPDREYDLVIATELFEHTPVWPQICLTAFKACKPGGRFIATMAGLGRPVHSGVDGGPYLHPGEHYANIDPSRLRDVLEAAGWVDVVIDVQPSPADVRVIATKPTAIHHDGWAAG